MKFSLFVHMERITAEQSHRQLYDEFLQLSLMAEAGGMTTVWTGEHHGMDFTIAPNPFINLADLAARTSTIRLGTGTIVAPFWHPIKLAGEAAMTDIICNGRLELGLARGAYSYEYERMVPGLDAWQAGLRLREMVPALKGLWHGDYELDGEFHSFPSTTSAPKPLQTNGPPLWIAARDENTHQFALQNGCNVQVTPLWQGMDEIQHLIEVYQAAQVAAQRQDSKIMLLQHCYVGKDQADVTQACEEISRFYCYFGAWFKNERPVQQGFIQPLSESEINALEMYSPSVMANNMPIGEASQVVQRIKQYEQLGYDEFSFWIDSGMSFDRKQASLKRFIDKVMPHFTDD